MTAIIICSHILFSEKEKKGRKLFFSSRRYRQPKLISLQAEPGHKATRLARDRERPDVALRRRDHQGIVYLGCFFGQTTIRRGVASLFSLPDWLHVIFVLMRKIHESNSQKSFKKDRKRMKKGKSLKTQRSEKNIRIVLR